MRHQRRLLGAAVFDGQNQYMLYGFGHSNLIVKNVPALLSPASHLLAGVGRANNSNNVGNANNVNGLAGSTTSTYNFPSAWALLRR